MTTLDTTSPIKHFTQYTLRVKNWEVTSFHLIYSTLAQHRQGSYSPGICSEDMDSDHVCIHVSKGLAQDAVESVVICSTFPELISTTFNSDKIEYIPETQEHMIKYPKDQSAWYKNCAVSLTITWK
jgi:hypothetical protein